MATIYTYPQKTTLSSDDLILLSDSASTPTTNITKSATLDNLSTYVQQNIDAVTSVDLAVPSAFSVSGNPITTSGTITISGAGTTSQYVDGTGALQTFSDSIDSSVAKLIPFNVVASAGGSSTYSANNNIVEIGWTGGNGTYVLNIPSAATIPYRNIRFVTNSTFPNGASDKVEITAQAGETIDGAASFEISKVYEGVSIWSTGSEWIVIQAKAH
jgi:hypothetical protein